MDPLIRIGEQRTALSAVLFDKASRSRYLEKVHTQGERVLCLCHREGVPMGVALRDSTFYLYPLHHGDGQRHAPGCPHRTEASVTSGIIEHPVRIDGDTINIKIDGVIQKSGLAGSGKDRRMQQVPLETVHRRSTGLRTILDVLWNEGELNVWRPGFTGKRHYGVVRHHLLEASRNVRVKGHHLTDLLFIPPAFKPERSDVIERETTAYLQRRLPDESGRQTQGFVLGLVRDLELAKDGAIVIHLAHSRMALWVKKESWDGLSKIWFSQDLDATRPLMVLARVEGREGRRGSWLQVTDLATMPLVSYDTWLPSFGPEDSLLCEKLVQTCRAFRKPLGAERGNVPMPAYVLEDREDRMLIEIDTPRRRTMEAAYALLKQPVTWVAPPFRESSLPTAD